MSRNPDTVRCQYCHRRFTTAEFGSRRNQARAGHERMCPAGPGISPKKRKQLRAAGRLGGRARAQNMAIRRVFGELKPTPPPPTPTRWLPDRVREEELASVKLEANRMEKELAYCHDRFMNSEHRLRWLPERLRRWAQGR